METTYKIIGGDGQEYGPASLAELQAWVLEGRLLPLTLVWCSTTERWEPAARIPELADSLARVLGPGYRVGGVRSDMPARPVLRLGAFLMDMVVIGLVGGLIWPMVANLCGWDARPHSEAPSLKEVMEFVQRNEPLFFFFNACRVFYETLFIAAFGATPGKYLLGLRVVGPEGERVGFLAAALRCFGRLLCEFAFYLGYLPILFRGDRRGLHDLLSGTWVVATRRFPRSQPEPQVGGQ